MDAAQLLAKVSGSLHVLMLYRLLLTPKLMMMAGSGRKSLDNNDYVGCGDGFVVHDDMEGNEDDINDGNDAGDVDGDSMMGMMMAMAMMMMMMMMVIIIIIIIIITIIIIIIVLVLDSFFF